MSDRLKRLRESLGTEPSETAKELSEKQAGKLGADLRGIKERAMGVEIPQTPPPDKILRPIPAPYETQYADDQKFKDARNKLVDQSKRMMPSGMDAQRLKELQNQLDMEESEAEFDGMTPEVQQKIMRLKEAIKRMGG